MNSKRQLYVLVGCGNLDIMHQHDVERDEASSPLSFSREKLSVLTKILPRFRKLETSTVLRIS